MLCCVQFLSGVNCFTRAHSPVRFPKREAVNKGEVINLGTIHFCPSYRTKVTIRTSEISVKGSTKAPMSEEASSNLDCAARLKKPASAFGKRSPYALLMIPVRAKAEEFDVVSGSDARFARGDFDLARDGFDAFKIGKQKASA